MKINILLPVYNDWDSINLLLKDIEKIQINNKLNITSIDITIINDCSTLPPIIIKDFKQFKIKIITLFENLGSQLAINCGLRYLDENNIDFDYCITMDSDGEDKAEDILTLLNVATKNNEKIVFASRGKRQDGLLFYFLYKIYLFIFYFCTGKNINFGNFSCIHKSLIKIVARLDNSKIHHSASILRSNLSFTKIKCDRGKRFIGKSKMSLKNLVLHGLNSMAIFFELILIRFLILISLLITLSLIFIFILKINDLFEKFYWFNLDQFYLAALFSSFIIIGILIYLKTLSSNIKRKIKKKFKLTKIMFVDKKINY